MADDVTQANIAAAANMPFTAFVMERQAEYAKEHPGAPWTRFEDLPIGQTTIALEAKVATDFATGRISAEDFERFRDLSEARAESLRTHLDETGREVSDALGSWRDDAVSTLRENGEAHRGDTVDVTSGNPTLASAAESINLVVNVVEPSVDLMADGAHTFVEVVHGELAETVRQFDEARGAQQGLNPGEVAWTHVKVEAVRDDYTENVTKAQGEIETWREQMHDTGAKLERAADELRDVDAQHPGQHINDLNPAAIEDPHLHDAIVQETQVTEG
jgi:hypothetical protein